MLILFWFDVVFFGDFFLIFLVFFICFFFFGIICWIFFVLVMFDDVLLIFVIKKLFIEEIFVFVFWVIIVLCIFLVFFMIFFLRGLSWGLYDFVKWYGICFWFMFLVSCRLGGILVWGGGDIILFVERMDFLFMYKNINNKIL